MRGDRGWKRRKKHKTANKENIQVRIANKSSSMGTTQGCKYTTNIQKFSIKIPHISH